MKKIFLDTNFIADYLLREEYKAVSRKFLENGIAQGARFYISFLTVANFAYICRKLPKSELYEYLETISSLFMIVENTREQILSAIKHRASDFEDALQYECAYAARCEVIITRNNKDFSFSNIPVMSAFEYMEKNAYGRSSAG